MDKRVEFKRRREIMMKFLLTKGIGRKTTGAKKKKTEVSIFE